MGFAKPNANPKSSSNLENKQRNGLIRVWKRNERIRGGEN